jgi:hypothetical protein
MRPAFAIAAGAPCFSLSAALLGFINLATYEAVSSWGITEALNEISGTTWNISVFIGCWCIGLTLLWLGASILRRRLFWPLNRAV